MPLTQPEADVQRTFERRAAEIDSGTASSRTRESRPTRRRRLMLAAAVALVLLVVASVVAIVRYAPAVDDALSIRRELRAIISAVTDKGHQLDSATLATVRADARRVGERQARLARALAGDPLIAIARSLPGTESQVRSADGLVAAAGLVLGVVNDGMDLADRFVTIRDGARGSSKLEALVGLAADSRDELARASTAVGQALELLDAIPDAAAPQILAARDEAREQLRHYRPLLDEATEASAFIPSFMGWDRRTRYLVVLQDPAELRPTGGYIGQYGIVVFDHGRIVEKTFSDIAVLYEQKGLPYVAPPAPLLNHLLGPHQSWRLADANWSPDFATSAAAADRMYAIETKDRRIDGVIGLTTFAVDDLLELTGPVEVPNYGLTVRPGHSTFDILAATRSPARPGGDRKAVLGAFADRLLEQLFALPAAKWADVPGALERMRGERHAALWIKDAALQDANSRAGWAGAIPDATGDEVIIVESNVGPVSKLHLVTDRAIDVDVTLDDAGNAHTLLTLQYDNRIRDPGDPELKRVTDFLRSYQRRDELGIYLRVLVPRAAQVAEVTLNSGKRSIGGLEAIDEELGRRSFGAYVVVPPGKTTLQMGWVTPAIVDATADGRRRYTLSVPKPAGRLNDLLRIVVRLPAAARVVGVSDPRLVVTEDQQRSPVVVVSEPFRADVSIAVTFELP